MRVVVIGASGNVGTSVVDALSADRSRQVVAVGRRVPASWPAAAVTWQSVDILRDDLSALLAGVDAVIHLAWRFHPCRRPVETWPDNVSGTARVLEAAAVAGIGTVVVASSIGAYSPAPGDEPVDETWPTEALPAATYGLQKSYVERLLDGFVAAHPETRIVRIRPAFVFKRPAAPEQRRIFAGPLLPGSALRFRVPIVPVPSGLRLQAVHADNLARAYVAAVELPVAGAFNVAADPVLHADDVAAVLRGKELEVDPRLFRIALAAMFRLRLTPSEPGLFDLFRSLPVMDTTRARTELGWTPRHTAVDAIAEFIDGLARPVGGPTPRLDLHAGGLFRAREVATGVGARE